MDSLKALLEKIFDYAQFKPFLKHRRALLVKSGIASGTCD
jgi:hypothetical protein